MTDKKNTLIGGIFSGLESIRIASQDVAILNLAKESRCSAENAEKQYAITGWAMTHFKGIVLSLIAVIKSPTKTGAMIRVLQYHSGVFTLEEFKKSDVFEFDTSQANLMLGVSHASEGGHAISRRDNMKLIPLISSPILLIDQPLTTMYAAMVKLLGFNVVLNRALVVELKNGRTDWDKFSQENRTVGSVRKVFDDVRGLLIDDLKAFKSSTRTPEAPKATESTVVESTEQVEETTADEEVAAVAEVCEPSVTAETHVEEETSSAE